MSLEDYRKDIYHCVKCGACRIGYDSFLPICPSGEKFGFNSYYAQGRLDIAKGLIEGSLTWTDKLLHRVFTCTDCNACQEFCYDQTGIKPAEIIKELRSAAVENSSVPLKIRDFLENIYKYGNPYKGSKQMRGKWADGMNIREYSRNEFLLYAGCVSSYDEIGQQIAKAVGEVLLKAGVSFGILGEREMCDGNEVNRLGEKGLFQVLAEKNIDLFNKIGVTKIITVSPHSYHTMKNYYPEFGGNFQVMHYTQFIKELIRDLKLDLSLGLNAKVTYHDSCYLGRHNKEYEAPREILASIPGLELIELPRNRNNSFCCGGGGGNFFSDLLGSEENSPSRLRIREAYTNGAEIIAVACPICAVMLKDALLAENLENKLMIKDISEIVRDVCCINVS